MDRGRPSSRYGGRPGDDLYDDEYDYVRGGDNTRRYRPPSSLYSRSSSLSSAYSRSPSPRRRTRSAPRAANPPPPAPAPPLKKKHSSSGLKTTAGVVAGVGLATLALHRMFGDRDHHDHARHHHGSGHDHKHKEQRPRDVDRRLEDPQHVKDRLRRRSDDIRAFRTPQNGTDGNAVRHRTTVRKTGDAIVYEDVVPARDVEALGAGRHGDRAMREKGYERIAAPRRRRSLDEEGRDRHLDQRHHRHHPPRWEEDGQRQQAYIDR
jgi:hypothetical protein